MTREDPNRASTAHRSRLPDWVAERLPAAIFRIKVDSDLAVVALTDRFEALTGIPVRALIGNSYAKLIHPDDREQALAAATAVAELATPNKFEYRLIAADGSVLWIRQEAWPVESGDANAREIEGFLFDVTDARRVQQREVERQFAHARQQRCLVELATHPTIADGEIEAASRIATERVAELVGVERVGVWLLDDAGVQLELVDLFVRADASHQTRLSMSARDYPSYFEALHSGRSVDAHDALSDPRTREFAEPYLRPLGITSMLDATIRIAGKVAGVLCLEHVGPARRWQKYEAEFAGEVADQLSLALLNRARIAAQAEQEELRAQLFHSQKMDALGRLAGGVAHDFNNVLMAISGNAELLAMAVEQPLLKRSAQEIVDASFRAGELVGQLLRFARREPLTLRTIDLVDTVGGMQGMLRRLLTKRIRFEVLLPSAAIHVRATETLIQQVLTNLVVNARDAVDDDGTIRIELETSEVAELGEQPRVNACIRVIDDGVGMSPEVQAKVFEPFFTTKDPGKGTGLGLATVYSIVRRCGGSVEIASELDHGTSMTLLLPLVDA